MALESALPPLSVAAKRLRFTPNSSKESDTVADAGGGVFPKSQLLAGIAVEGAVSCSTDAASGAPASRQVCTVCGVCVLHVGTIVTGMIDSQPCGASSHSAFQLVLQRSHRGARLSAEQLDTPTLTQGSVPGITVATSGTVQAAPQADTSNQPPER